LFFNRRLLFSFNYTPTLPEPPNTPNLKCPASGVHSNELKVAEEFWDFLGGKGTYPELLDCFERAGIELRPEIDKYFLRFK
jgi:type II restriction enzyme